MEAISAKLKSISFRRKSTGARPVIDLKKWKLLRWLFPCAALMAACLSHIYQVSYSLHICFNINVCPFMSFSLPDDGWLTSVFHNMLVAPKTLTAWGWVRQCWATYNWFYNLSYAIPKQLCVRASTKRKYLFSGYSLEIMNYTPELGRICIEIHNCY